MSLVPINGVGRVGIVTDSPPHTLPANAWTDGLNVRMWKDQVQKFLGHSAVFGTPSAPPYFLLPVQGLQQFFWAYPTWDGANHRVFATDMIQHANITRASGVYDPSGRFGWTGGMLGGIPFLNNGVDPPQYWPLPTGLSTLLANLPNWPAATTCASLRAYKQFLIAVDVTEAGTRFPTVVRWSHPADPGSVPSSWDFTSAILDSGRQSIDTKFALIDSLGLGDLHILYASDSVWYMQLTGRPRFPFTIRRMFPDFGLLARHCAKEFAKGQHLVATREDLDLVVHDGTRWESILDDRRRTQIREDISTDFFERSFIVLVKHRTEAWFCYPSQASLGFADKALVWNWKSNTFGTRDLPQIPFAESGLAEIGAASQVWDSDSAAWDTDADPWDIRTFKPTNLALLMAAPNVTKLFLADTTNQADDASFTAFVERIGMNVMGADKNGNLIQSNDFVKFISEIWPDVDMAPDDTINISVGSQMQLKDAISWHGPFPFTPSQDSKIDCAVTARYWAIRFESKGNVDWKLNGYRANIVQDGLY